MKSISKFLILILPIFLIAAESFRTPAISPDGSEIAFSWQGDIWKVPTKGGLANRLTSHPGYESHPVWSPKSNAVAFDGYRYGNRDIFTVDFETGETSQITFNSAADFVYDWTETDELLFASNRNFRSIDDNKEMHRISAVSGTPNRILNAFGEEPTLSPGGRYIAFSKGECKTEREAYRGSADLNIFIYDTKTDEYRQITTDEGQDYMPRWKNESTLFFLSARTGRYNIFSVNVENPDEKEQITDFSDFGIRYFSCDNGGKHIVFTRMMGIELFNMQSREFSKANITVINDEKFDNLIYKKYDDSCNDYAISPSGKFIALEIHGEIFIMKNDSEDDFTRNLSQSNWRDLSPVWISDNDLLFLSDRYGQYDIYLATAEDDLFNSIDIEMKKITSSKEDVQDLVLSPDGKRLAFTRGNAQLVVAEISKKHQLKHEIILSDSWAKAETVRWSPDSKWLAYSQNNIDYNREIYIQKAETGAQPINISQHPRGDYNPVWSPDGSKLGFSTSRFLPSIYHELKNDICFVWLKQKDADKTKRQWKENNESESQDFSIDTKNIYRRMVRVTDFPGNEYEYTFSKDGEKIYFAGDYKDKQAVYAINWNGDDLEVKAEKVHTEKMMQIDDACYFLSKGKLKKLDKNLTSMDFEAELTIDIFAERSQMFEEGWRTILNRFYDPQHHKQDWRKIKSDYKELVLSATCTEDYRDYYELMLGQLNASHMGYRGYSSSGETQKVRTGKLGIEIEPLEKGAQITHIIPDTPADICNLKIGDVILEVNHQPVSKDENFYALLRNTSGKKTLLKIQRGKSIKTVTIYPASSVSKQLYDDLVQARRKLVNDWSNGKLGYIHIMKMNWESFEEFEQDLQVAGDGKEGIVIDVRNNGGGWTTDFLMSILNTKQHAYTIPRGAAENLDKEHANFRENYAFGERLPFYSWNKKSVALCNADSYSNAEIFAHAYKSFGIGTLVGEQTFGAVISTTEQKLIDGSYVRLPFRAWYVKTTDTNMEHNGAIPDIEVQNPIGWKAGYNDNQLKTAVKALLKQL